MIPHRRGGYPHRGGRGKSPLVQHGNRTLIAQGSASASSTAPNKDHPLYGQFLEYLKTQGQDNDPSFAAKVKEDPNEDDSKYIPIPHKDNIIMLENEDIMRYFENDENPWILMNRYLDTASYAPGSYKSRSYYENILIHSGSAELDHYHGNNPSIYNFSKITIKQIISVEDWGISTLKEKKFFYANQPKAPVKYTYWDYVESFNKVFLYENPLKKHSWWIKICPNVYKRKIPIWFYKWWISHGPSIQILPDVFKDLYVEWVGISPRLSRDVSYIKGGKEILPSLHFFMEFSIPWIWKWVPEVDYSPNDFSMLKRSYLTKFWKKMNTINPETKELYSKQTLEEIQAAIRRYKEMKSLKDESSPFQFCVDRLREQLHREPAQEEIIEAYMDQMKKDLINQFSPIPSDDSMKSGPSPMESPNLAGESQPIEEDEVPEIPLEDLLEEMKDSLKKSLIGRTKKPPST